MTSYLLLLDLGDNSWKDLVENPDKWWDNRSNKVTPLDSDYSFIVSISHYFVSCLWTGIHRGMQNLPTLSTKKLVKVYGSVVRRAGCYRSCHLPEVNKIRLLARRIRYYLES